MRNPTFRGFRVDSPVDKVFLLITALPVEIFRPHFDETIPLILGQALIQFFHGASKIMLATELDNAYADGEPFALALKVPRVDLTDRDPVTLVVLLLLCSLAKTLPLCV